MAIKSFSGQYRFLSNFWPVTITLGSWSFPTVEHAYQFSKTTDMKFQALIAAAKTPGQAKRLGAKAPLRLSWHWHFQKVRVMEKLLRQKFSNPLLAQKLLETGTEILIEGNTWGDRFWGQCGGIGQNQLGQLLMTLRVEMRLYGNVLPERPRIDLPKEDYPCCVD